MSVPGWVADAVFYQIFPDRFANGNLQNDPPNVQPWGAAPTVHGYQGGDLEGIRQKLDYLADLGINGIYLNPIFLSPSNHRYHTTNYYQIDPFLGSREDFNALLDAAHRQGIRIILDGVFNHSSRGFHAFNDLMENEAESPYRNWFHVRRFPLRAYEPGHARNYQAWWGIKGLPKFNTDYLPVRRYLLNVARYWIEQGLDGWRLDVPNEIDDDDFWAEFREVVRAANPEAYLVGEIWHIWPRWANDSHFDGLMNYPLRTAILELLTGHITANQFGQQVESLLTVYPRENVYAMYNLLGSHDTERILTHFGGDGRKVSLAFLFLFAYPGVPSIYYGDEVAMRGGKDPGSRGAFPWEPAQRDEGLRVWVKKLVAARKASAALTRGDFIPLFAGEADGSYAFARRLNGEQVIIAMNGRDTTATVPIPTHALALEDGHTLQSLLDDRQVTVTDGAAVVTLDPYSGIYLR